MANALNYSIAFVFVSVISNIYIWDGSVQTMG